MTIHLSFERKLPPDLDPGLLIRAIQTTLDRHNQHEVDITLKLTNDENMRQLNNKYRDVDSTTDVLAFNQDFIDPETDRLYLGDIIISIETAQSQALENAHSLNEECTLLAVHGTLHLLGYDHYDPEEKDDMWRIQEKILKDLIPNTQEDVE